MEEPHVIDLDTRAAEIPRMLSKRNPEHNMFLFYSIVTYLNLPRSPGTLSSSAGHYFRFPINQHCNIYLNISMISISESPTCTGHNDGSVICDDHICTTVNVNIYIAYKCTYLFYRNISPDPFIMLLYLVPLNNPHSQH